MSGSSSNTGNNLATNVPVASVVSAGLVLVAVVVLIGGIWLHRRNKRQLREEDLRFAHPDDYGYGRDGHVDAKSTESKSPASQWSSPGKPSIELPLPYVFPSSKSHESLDTLVRESMPGPDLDVYAMAKMPRNSVGSSVSLDLHANRSRGASIAHPLPHRLETMSQPVLNQDQPHNEQATARRPTVVSAYARDYGQSAVDSPIMWPSHVAVDTAVEQPNHTASPATDDSPTRYDSHAVRELPKSYTKFAPEIRRPPTLSSRSGPPMRLTSSEKLLVISPAQQKWPVSPLSPNASSAWL